MNLRELAQSESLNLRSKDLREMVLSAISSGGRGHIGPALSLLEIVSTLYDTVLRHDPKNPSWGERDIFLLSKGHGCLGLYAVLAQHGYFPREELVTFCRYDSRLGGHPEWHNLPGIEFSTGSLGHGLPVAVGLGRAFQLQNSHRRVFVLVGDGELGEGAIWEAAMHAAKYRMKNLTLIVDFNSMQAHGNLDAVLPLEDLSGKFKSFGFDVLEVNGHSRDSLTKAFTETRNLEAPKVVIAYTIKGKGIPAAENSPEWHHKAKITKDEVINLLLEKR